MAGEQTQPSSGQNARDDGKPHLSPIYHEGNAIRYELPIEIAGVKGLLFVRCVTSGRKKDEVEVSIRGKAAAMLDRIGR